MDMLLVYLADLLTRTACLIVDALAPPACEFAAAPVPPPGPPRGSRTLLRMRSKLRCSLRIL